MKFKLPNHADLTIEQMDIVNLPPNKNWVIQGSPGMGRTIMATYKAKQMELYENNVLYLVYNRYISQFLSSEASICKTCETKTWYQWLPDIWLKKIGYPLPMLSPFEPDWASIIPQISSVGRIYDYIIVDEAQDFPEELIEILVALSKNITCFVNPDQLEEMWVILTSSPRMWILSH